MQQHHTMLSDDIRMKIFRLAIETRVSEGDVVLDAGSGTGILSYIALQAGASRVYAVERSKTISVARRLAEENGFADRMTFIKGDIMSVRIPEKVDGVLCELLGYCGLGENIINVLNHVRKNHLKPGGWLLPRTMKVFIVPMCDPALYTETFMENVDLGISIEALKDELAHEYWVKNLSIPSFVSEPGIVKDVCFEKKANPDTMGSCVVEITRTANIHGLGSWFESELAPGITMDTRPGPPFTHWSQVYFPFRRPMSAQQGDSLHINLATTSDEDGELFNWSAELRRGEITIDTIAQSNALSYSYLPGD